MANLLALVKEVAGALSGYKARYEAAQGNIAVQGKLLTDLRAELGICESANDLAARKIRELEKALLTAQGEAAKLSEAQRVIAQAETALREALDANPPP